MDPKTLSSQFVDIMLETAAEVGSFIFRDNIFAAEALKKCAHFIVGLLGFLLVGHLADFSHR